MFRSKFFIIVATISAVLVAFGALNLLEIDLNSHRASKFSKNFSIEKNVTEVRGGLLTEDNIIYPDEDRVLIDYREGEPEFGHNHTIDEWTKRETDYLAEDKTEEALNSEFGDSAKNVSVITTSLDGDKRVIMVEYNTNRTYPFSYSELVNATPEGYSATVHFGNYSNAVQIPVVIENVTEPAYNLVHPANQTQNN